VEFSSVVFFCVMVLVGWLERGVLLGVGCGGGVGEFLWGD
jgi:hypothetical protein